MKDTLSGLGAYKVEIDDDALDYLITMSNNDARAALNTLETATLIHHRMPTANGASL